MASKTDTSTAGRSDLSTVTAAALRLDPLLRKIRDGLSQYLEAFELAIHGARRQDIEWPLFTVVVPDPGDGGTIDPVPQEAGDFVGFDNFGIYKFNIPVSEADIETAASYLRHCGLDPDAQRLLEVFKELKAAFCSVGEYIRISDDSTANRKFYAQGRALMLSEHLEDLIRTLPTILTGGGAGQSELRNQPSAAETWFPTAPEVGSRFQHGPIEGTLKQLEGWLKAGSQPTLRKHNGQSWWYIRKLVGRRYAVWCDSQKKHAEANQRRLEEKNRATKSTEAQSNRLKRK